MPDGRTARFTLFQIIPPSLHMAVSDWLNSYLFHFVQRHFLVTSIVKLRYTGAREGKDTIRTLKHAKPLLRSHVYGVVMTGTGLAENVGPHANLFNALADG